MDKDKSEKKDKIERPIEKKKCGIIMPISSHPDYPKDHWKEVLNILVEAVNETDFEPRLVSDDVAIGLIHERIVNNIYNDDIIVCDVSSKNPNVMFELGMRLAFDKPTIIIKDENTGYSFDTGVIEHINYPSSLRFNKIIEFKKELIKKINATYSKSQSKKNFSPFLKSFGKTIVPAKIHQTEIPESQYILSKLENITNEIQLLRMNQVGKSNPIYSNLTRKRIVGNKVDEFLDVNPHLDKEFVLKSLIDLLKDEVEKYHNFIPTTQEVGIAVERYFKNKEGNTNPDNEEAK
ncbi:RNA helicase [Riemerella anatipestifer]|nr:RNA helicase [Riemerella anatipestifer]